MALAAAVDGRDAEAATAVVGRDADVMTVLPTRRSARVGLRGVVTDTPPVPAVQSAAALVRVGATADPPPVDPVAVGLSSAVLSTLTPKSAAPLGRLLPGRLPMVVGPFVGMLVVVVVVVVAEGGPALWSLWEGPDTAGGGTEDGKGPIADGRRIGSGVAGVAKEGRRGDVIDDVPDARALEASTDSRSTTAADSVPDAPPVPVAAVAPAAPPVAETATCATAACWGGGYVATVEPWDTARGGARGRAGVTASAPLLLGCGAPAPRCGRKRLPGPAGDGDNGGCGLGGRGALGPTPLPAPAPASAAVWLEDPIHAAPTPACGPAGSMTDACMGA